MKSPNAAIIFEYSMVSSFLKLIIVFSIILDICISCLKILSLKKLSVEFRFYSGGVLFSQKIPGSVFSFRVRSFSETPDKANFNYYYFFFLQMRKDSGCFMIKYKFIRNDLQLKRK